MSTEERFRPCTYPSCGPCPINTPRCGSSVEWEAWQATYDAEVDDQLERWLREEMRRWPPPHVTGRVGESW